MLSKKQRFSSKGFPKAKPFFRASFPWGSVVYFSSPTPKAAVVVSKKIAKTAVMRNRLRRRLYAALREVYKTYPATVVVYPNKNSTTTPIPTLIADIMKARV